MILSVIFWRLSLQCLSVSFNVFLPHSSKAVFHFKCKYIFVFIKLKLQHTLFIAFFGFEKLCIQKVPTKHLHIIAHTSKYHKTVFLDANSSICLTRTHLCPLNFYTLQIHPPNICWRICAVYRQVTIQKYAVNRDNKAWMPSTRE